MRCARPGCEDARDVREFSGKWSLGKLSYCSAYCRDIHWHTRHYADLASRLMQVALPVQDECWVLGNGRTLLERPWPVDAVLFGCNYVFLAGIYPDAYFAVDQRLIQGNAEAAMHAARRAKIVYLSSLVRNDPLPEIKALYDLPHAFAAQDFVPSYQGEIAWAGGSVTYVMVKEAHRRGFKKIHLIGVDQEPEFTHFDDTYPTAARPKRDLLKYHLALAVYNGTNLINHSAPSHLDEPPFNIPRGG